MEPAIVHRCSHGIFLVIWLTLLPPIYADGPTQLNQWAGEALGANDGALFLSFEHSKKSTDEDKKIQSEVTVSVINLVTKQTFVFSQGVGKFPIPVLWRIPAGKYAVRSLKALGSDGKVYNAKFQKKEGKRFVIKKLHISQLSSWMVFTVSGESLKVGIRKQKNSYKPQDANTLKSFKGIINGLTGKMELPFDTPDLEEAAKVEHSTPKKLRKSLASTLSIAMFFRLNLFKNNSYAPQVASVIAGADQKLRKCYTDALDRNPELKGEIVFRFAISKETGTFKKIAASRSQLADEELQECLVLNLKQLSLPATKSMLGELVLNFDYSE